MQWIAPSEKDTAYATLEKQLWAAADQLHALNKKNKNLCQTRDLLLSRVRSGQVNFGVSAK